MKYSARAFVIAVAALSLFAGIDAQPSPKKDKNAPVTSVTNGDPPPGGAATMAHRTALFLVRDLMPKRSYWGTSIFNPKTLGSVAVSSEKMEISIDTISWSLTHNTNSKATTILFKDLDYASSRSQIYKKETHYLVYFPKSIKLPVDDLFFLWKTEAEAKNFTDAINRLIYDAHRGYTLAKFEEEFNAGAKKWREDPASRPKPPDVWDKYRILAEQRINEKDYPGAALQYEEGLSEFPYWPEGWFNAAIIYDELRNYAEAADRMKHYLVLMPDAPDAQAAREKIIIWEDKAKRGP